MKIAQIECDKTTTAVSAATQIQRLTAADAVAVTTAAVTSTTTTAAVAPKSKASTLLGSNENAICKDAAAATDISTKMTDERNINNSSSGNNNSNHDSNRSKDKTGSSNKHRETPVNSETSKYLLKNGINGTDVASATFLPAAATAATFQLPAPPPPPPPLPVQPTATNSAAIGAAKAYSSSGSSLYKSAAPAHTGNAATSTAVAGAPVNNSSSCNSRSPHRISENNGISLSTTSSTTQQQQLKSSKTKMAATTAASSAAAAAAAAMHLGVTSPPAAHMSAISMKAMDIGVIDYTVNTVPHRAASAAATSVNNNNKNKFSSQLPGSSGSVNDTGRHALCTTTAVIGGSISSNSSGGASAYGGRLQFFKDGKFILELARSKDGEKGGWISVPRKQFRTPSATSSTVTPTLATTTAYPKNESSTSLSFSDDNSSVQSSPWQRDHCWKQSAPRYGISKEMSLYYRRPKNIFSLTTKALLVAQRKRRKPHDATTTTFPTFECLIKVEKNMANAKSTAFSKIDKAAEEKPDGTINALDKSVNCKVENENKEVEDKNILSVAAAKNGDMENSEEDGSTSSSSTSTETLKDESNCMDTAISGSKTPTPGSPSETINTAETQKDLNVDVPSKRNVSTSLEEKMSTSEDDDAMSPSSNEEVKPQKIQINGIVDVATAALTEKDVKINVNSNMITSSTTAASKNANETAGEEKRLKKKIKTRAKLITVIQKLIDRMPARLVHLSKTALVTSGSYGGGAINNSNNILTHKVSPPSSSSSAAASSRLVEYHQQHVSPRKRILREFEKVSLEDNIAAAGAKRSRAKSNAAAASAAAAAAQLRNTKSPTNRLQTGNNSISATTLTTASATAVSTVANGSTKTKTPVTTAAPTRLYSSYSIHSLLGGSNNSSSTSSTSSASALVSSTSSTVLKKANDHLATASNIDYAAHAHAHSHAHTHQHQHLQSQNFTDPSYLRAMLASPKSPESSSSCGGKSPSNSASKKRSPPYTASPLHDAHSRSPTVTHTSAGGNVDYGRRSPRVTPPETATLGNYKMRYGAVEHSNVTTVAHSPSHHHLQQHQQGFYSPYMMSPKYVPAPGSSISPRHASAFSSTASGTSLSKHNIPNSSNTSGIVGVATNSNSLIPNRELSPPRSSPASPRESTPRTVPKKTASIRRQFASPTASTTSSCPSPSERATCDETATTTMQQERKTPVYANAQQQMMQRGSPSGSCNVSSAIAGPAALASSSPLHYYMYQQPPSSGATQSAAHSAAASLSSHPAPNTSTSAAAAAAVAAAAAAAAAAYIPSVVAPPFYHPYIHTLAALRHNSMWMHYPGTVSPVMAPHHSVAPQTTASARLSPPFHSFPYNGVNSVAMAAAAAAAAFGGSGGGTPSHMPPGATHHQLQQHHMLIPNTALQTHGSGLGMINTQSSTKLTTDSTTDLPSLTKYTTSNSTPAAATIISNASTTLYANSIKEELSSDVPLNLSKH